MGWSRLQSLKSVSRTGSAANVAATFASNVTQGSRIFVYTNAVISSNNVAVIDGQSNTYTKLVSGGSSATVFADIWTAVASSTGSLQITVSSATGQLGWTAEEYSGLDGSAGTGCRDVSAAGTANNNTTANADSGTTAATAADNQLALSMIGDWGNGVTWTVTSGTGFTKNSAASLDNDANTGIAVGNRLSATGSAEHCVWTEGGTADTDVALVVVVKLAAASTPIVAIPWPEVPGRRLKGPRKRQHRQSVIPQNSPRPFEGWGIPPS